MEKNLGEHALRTLVILLLTAVVLVSILKYVVIDVKPAGVKADTVERISNPFFIENVERYPMSIEVVNDTNKLSLGVVADPEIFKFGRIEVATQSRKVMNINNPTSRPAKVNIFVFGNISNFTHVGSWRINWTDKWEYVVPPKSNISIEVGVEGRKKGNYTGELVIVSRIPRIPIGGLIKWI